MPPLGVIESVCPNKDTLPSMLVKFMKALLAPAVKLPAILNSNPPLRR